MTSLPATSGARSVCHTCGAPLDGAGLCLRCAFTDALNPELVEAGSAVLPPEGMDGLAADHASFTPLDLPARFGRYELKRELARGGMGVVYEAADARLNRTVALKMIRGFAFSTAEEKARFKTEAEAAAQLDHPHIVPIYEVDEVAGQPFFTMKLIEGESLAERLRQKNAGRPREVVALIAKVAQAVHHAHQRGVLHRDLKPGNILLDGGGSRG